MSEVALDPELIFGYRAEWWYAVAKVSVYFISLFVCFSHVLADMAWGVRARRVPDTRKSSGSRFSLMQRLGIATRNVLLVVFGLVNVVVAWYHIWLFMEEDRKGHTSVAEWVAKGDWFVQAYKLVTATPQQWFFSSQLLQGVCTIVVFTYVESIRCGRIRPLSSFWLGCAAAISLSTPLLLAAVMNTPREVLHRRYFVPSNRLLFVGVVLSSVATTFLPFVDSSNYTVLLAIIHAALLVPLALLQWMPRAHEASERSYQVSNEVAVTRRRLVLHSVASLWVPVTYTFLAGISFMSQLNNFLAVIVHAKGPSVFITLRDAVCCNPCQCSISGDVAAVSLLVAVWIALSNGVPKSLGIPLALLTPLLSFSTTLPAFLACREIVLAQRRAAVAEKMLVTTDKEANMVGIKRVPPSPSTESIGESIETPQRVTPQPEKKTEPLVEPESVQPVPTQTLRRRRVPEAS